VSHFVLRVVSTTNHDIAIVDKSTDHSATAAFGTPSDPKRVHLPGSPPAEVLSTKPSVAAFYGVSERTIERWMRRRVIPFFKIGGKVRFRLSDVVASLERNNLRHTRD
jgi:excisionase family DNA binding protein